MVKLLRGLLFYRAAVFLGKSVRMDHKHWLFIGRGTLLNDFVDINALSINGVRIGQNCCHRCR